MIPASYANFLAASTQASAALIGLLFVSASIAPERVFGPQAEAGRLARALSSFTALVNVFFISLSSLIPNQPIGPVVVVLGAVAGSQTLSLLLLLPGWRRERTIIRGLSLFAISGAVYGYEIAIGLRLWFTPTNTGALTTLLQLLLGGYGIGLVRAWELLGAPHRRGITANVLSRLWAWLASPVTDAPSLEDTARRPHDR